MLLQMADPYCTMKPAKADRRSGGPTKSQAALFGNVSSFRITHPKAYRKQDF